MKHFFFLITAFTFAIHQVSFGMNDKAEQLYQSFLTPPDSIRVGCYYYWVNEHVDPKGVKADLQWMKQNGITLAFLATDIRNRVNWENPWEGQTFGKNKFRSKLWWKNLRTALKTAGELGIEIGIFNCPGWSQSGGPWVKPEEAMRNWTPRGIEVCKTNRGTDVVCSPCSPEAEGLEVDKLSKRHVQKHFESFVGDILRRIPQKDRPTLTTVVVDSWERGKQNYTDSIFEKFQQRFGYPLDYQNAACKKDLDRLIAELVASEYMGGLTEKAHEYGLRTWCEPYAHSPFPGNSITYGSAADEVAAEFWVGDKKFRKKEVNAALGSARRSGKNRVWAECFTDGWPELAKDDWSFEKLKPIADRYFHAGINASILHVMISQPGDDSKPAVRPWFGTYFDRRSQNAKDLKPLVTYLRRCNFMLQLGTPFSNSTDCRIISDGTKILFTEESLFEVTFPDGRQELWNPLDGSKQELQSLHTRQVTVPVILTAGQSNADGRVPLKELPSEITYQQCMWSYGSGDFETATGHFVPYFPRVAKPGIEQSWGFDAIVYYQLEQLWKRPLYVIKHTDGGTAIDPSCKSSTHGLYWSADTAFLNHTTAASAQRPAAKHGGRSLLLAFERQIDEGLKHLPENYDIKFMLWHQGESDQQADSLYYANLKAVIAHIRQHLASVTGNKKYEHLPVLCANFSLNSRQRSQRVADALQRLSEEDPDFHVVEASDLPLLHDKLHFNAKGALVLGQRFFEKMKALKLTD